MAEPHLETWAGQIFETCCPPEPYGPCPPAGRPCYAPRRRDWCNTVHVNIWVNAPNCIIPPSGVPTYDGNADWRIGDERRLIIVPGRAMIGSVGIGASGTSTYVLIIDDASGLPMAWYIVKDWSFTTTPTGQDTNEVDWIALEVAHA